MNPTPFRIVFMGTPDFAVPSLQALLDHGETVLAVVTQPDRPKGRGRQLAAPPVKELALRHGLPVLQPEKIRTEAFRATMAGYAPDLMVVTAYGRILPGPLLRTPRLGTINVHGSLLPKYRGAAPIQWAVINNEVETGVTIMRMDEGMDTGDILLPAALPIALDDTSATLAPKLADLGGQTLARALDLLRENKLTAIPQDNRLATLAPPLTKEQGRIDWARPASVLSGLIRGLDPWPSASTALAGRRYKLFAPLVLAGQSNEQPGTLLRADALGLLLATGDGLLLIRSIQPEGGKRMAVSTFLPGHPLQAGAIFQ